MNVNKILTELEYRTGEIIDLTKPLQLTILSEILLELGYDDKFRNGLIKNIKEGANDGDNARTPKEVEKEQDDGYVSIGGSAHVKKRDSMPRPGKKGYFQPKGKDVQRYLKDPVSGNYVATTTNPDTDDIDPDNLEKSKDTGESEVNASGEQDNELQQNINQTFADPAYQKQIKDEESASNEGESGTGGTVFSIGGGYYSSTKNGKSEYKKVDESSNIRTHIDQNSNMVKLQSLVVNDEIIQIANTMKNDRLMASGKGAGGAVASFGESIYVDAVNNLNFKEFLTGNQDAIQQSIETIKARNNRKYPTASEKIILSAMGMSPHDPDAIEYLAARYVYSQQQLNTLKSTPKSVFFSSKGFKKDESKVIEWMNAAFDGSIATRKLLNENTSMDMSKPFSTFQSDRVIDDKLTTFLEEKLNEANKESDQESINHYMNELSAFEHHRKYHDTYVIGMDGSDRTTVYSVTNKKDDKLRDPHNNTTPSARLNVIKKDFGDTVANHVIEQLDAGIDKVDNVKRNTINSSNFVPLGAPGENGGVVDVMNTPEMKKYLIQLETAPKFIKFLKDQQIQITTLGTKEKLELMQRCSQSLTNPPYIPFGKLMMKLGELSTIQKYKDKYPNIDFDDSGIKQAIQIKETEKNVVKSSYKLVVDALLVADSRIGYPKNEINGPNVQGYINSVLSAAHFDSYIDDTHDKIILQMGIRGAFPSDVRNCLVGLSGYDGDVETARDRSEFKTFLSSRCKINAKTGAIILSGESGESNILEDVWRTAGTAQKVATSFGDGMRNCLTNTIDARRSSNVGK